MTLVLSFIRLLTISSNIVCLLLRIAASIIYDVDLISDNYASMRCCMCMLLISCRGLGQLGGCTRLDRLILGKFISFAVLLLDVHWFGGDR